MAVTYTFTKPEARQIARTLCFDVTMSQYIDWQKIAQTARELGSHWEVRSTPAHPIVVTFFWVVTADEQSDTASRS